MVEKLHTPHNDDRNRGVSPAPSEVHRGFSRARRENSPGPVVLVVERDGLLRWALYESLREGGYRILAVRDAVGAHELLEGTDARFDAAIVDDASWPLTAAAETWLRERWPGLPLLVLTGDASPALEHHVRRIGRADLLVKPFELPELLARVGRLVARGRRSRRREGRRTAAVPAAPLV